MSPITNNLSNVKLQIEVHEGYVLIVSRRYMIVTFQLIKTSNKVLYFSIAVFSEFSNFSQGSSLSFVAFLVSKIVMDYLVFIPIPIFLPLHLLLYLVIDTVFPFSVLAIKAVAQQRHLPNPGTLVS